MHTFASIHISFSVCAPTLNKSKGYKLHGNFAEASSLNAFWEWRTPIEQKLEGVRLDGPDWN